VTGNVAAGSNVSGADGARTFDIPDGLYSGKTATANDLDLVADNIRQGANIFGVAGSALAATGDATAADVLIGKTFSNASAAGIVGTMPNNEAVTIVPTTTNQTIALGYHDGSGKVEGDADLVASNIKGGVTIFGQTGTFQCVAKTGQSVSYAAGDDGYYQKGCLPAVLPGWDYDRSHFKCLGGLTDNGDGTVTDNTTGLMWMKDARCYPTGMNWWQALAEISFRNEYGWSCEGLSADFDDWRLPNINELRSLFDPDLPPPYLPAGHPFIRVKYGMGDRYWSSTSSSDFAVFIVFLYPSYGTAIELKEQTFYVWPVRGGQ
jgi:hypothetical protein